MNVLEKGQDRDFLWHNPRSSTFCSDTKSSSNCNLFNTEWIGKYISYMKVFTYISTKIGGSASYKIYVGQRFNTPKKHTILKYTRHDKASYRKAEGRYSAHGTQICLILSIGRRRNFVSYKHFLEWTAVLEIWWIRFKICSYTQW